MGGDFHTHDFKQHPNAPTVIQMGEATKGFRERPRQDPHFLADLETVIEANRPTAFTRGDQSLNHTRRHRLGLLRAHDQRGYAECPIDAAPPVFGQIDDDEHIPREKGLQRLPQPARVSNGPPQSWNETPEAQPMEIELRPVLLMCENSRDEPTLPWPQFQTIGQTFAPQVRLASLLLLPWRPYPLGTLPPFG